MEQESILVELVVRRRYRNMPPLMQKGYMLLREVLRLGVAVAIATVLVQHLRVTLAGALTVGLLWLLVEPWIRRETPGTSRVLLTDAGIYIMDDGLYLDWEDVGHHAVMGDVLVFETAAETAARGLFRSRQRRIPLGGETRREITELFSTRAGKPA